MFGENKLTIIESCNCKIMKRMACRQVTISIVIDLQFKMENGEKRKIHELKNKENVLWWYFYNN